MIVKLLGIGGLAAASSLVLLNLNVEGFVVYIDVDPSLKSVFSMIALIK